MGYFRVHLLDFFQNLANDFESLVTKHKPELIYIAYKICFTKYLPLRMVGERGKKQAQHLSRPINLNYEVSHLSDARLNR